MKEFMKKMGKHFKLGYIVLNLLQSISRARLLPRLRRGGCEVKLVKECLIWMGGFESFIVVADDRAYSSFSQFYSFTAVSQFSISLPLLGPTVLRCVSFHSHENLRFRCNRGPHYTVQA